jgi:hypothetical protein
VHIPLPFDHGAWSEDPRPPGYGNAKTHQRRLQRRRRLDSLINATKDNIMNAAELQNGLALGNASTEMKDYADCISAAALQNGSALEHAPEDLMQSGLELEHALHGLALEHASAELELVIAERVSNGARHLGMESPPSGVWPCWNEEQRGDRHGGGTLLHSESDFATNLAEEETTEATAPEAFETMTQENKITNAALYQDNKYNSEEAASTGNDGIPAKPSGNGSYGDEASPRKGSVLGGGRHTVDLPFDRTRGGVDATTCIA